MPDSKKCFERTQRFSKLYEMLDVTTKYSYLCRSKAEYFDRIVKIVETDIDAERKIILINEVIVSSEVSDG